MFKNDRQMNSTWWLLKHKQAIKHLAKKGNDSVQFLIYYFGPFWKKLSTNQDFSSTRFVIQTKDQIKQSNYTQP